MAEGGCFCGAVRYRVGGEPIQSDYCHCRMCQRAGGAPVVAWGTWPVSQVTWLKAEPTSFASSDEGRRSFCPACGTPLAFMNPHEPDTIDLTLASLDDPTLFPPRAHIWTSSQVAWLDLGDDLPRHPNARA
jgi:hypothetical protein